MEKLKLSGYALLALLGLLTLPGCGTTEETNKSCAVEEGAKSNFVKVINVLDPELYNDSHIAGSINIDFGKVVDTAKSENWPLNSKIVIYCSNYMCTASKEEARKLKELGYTDVSVYEGGMAQWYTLSKTDPSYKVVGESKQGYLTMPNEKPEKVGESDIPEITAQELKDILAK